MDICHKKWGWAIWMTFYVSYFLFSIMSIDANHRLLQVFFDIQIKHDVTSYVCDSVYVTWSRNITSQGHQQIPFTMKYWRICTEYNSCLHATLRRHFCSVIFATSFLQCHFDSQNHSVSVKTTGIDHIAVLADSNNAQNLLPPFSVQGMGFCKET